MADTDVAARLERIRDRIAAACARAGRPEDAVRLVAVCKRIDLDLVVQACRAGQWDLGENRIPEALDRQAGQCVGQLTNRLTSRLMGRPVD